MQKPADVNKVKSTFEIRRRQLNWDDMLLI